MASKVCVALLLVLSTHFALPQKSQAQATSSNGISLDNAPSMFNTSRGDLPKKLIDTNLVPWRDQSLSGQLGITKDIDTFVPGKMYEVWLSTDLKLGTTKIWGQTNEDLEDWLAKTSTDSISGDDTALEVLKSLERDYEPSLANSRDALFQVKVPAELLDPNGAWQQLERSFGLNQYESAQAIVGLSQVWNEGRTNIQSASDLKSFLLEQSSEVRQALNLLFCDNCLIIDGPSFVSVVYPGTGAGGPRDQLPVLGGGGMRGGNPGGTKSASPIELSWLAASGFMLGKRTAASRVVNSDGTFSFPRRQTFTEALMAEQSFCAKGIEGYDAMSSYREVPVMVGCGSVLVKDEKSTDQRVWLLTAKHCMSSISLASEVVVLRDWAARDSVENMIGKEPVSKEHYVLSPVPQKLEHPTADIAMMEVPDYLAAFAVPLPELGSPRVREGDPVTAVSYPLGLPVTLVSGADTIVSRVGPDEFWARVDNFASSSGSPIFSRSGQLEGILVSQPNADSADLDLWSTGSCVVLTDLSSDSSETAKLGARIVDARLAWDLIGR
jgi:hypothetical protein